jgi:tetratricopeptide (TPR) repeat protein
VAIGLLEKGHEAAKQDPELDFATDRLIDAYERVGERDKAQTVLVECWNLQKARLGREHDRTLYTMNRLGVAYWQKGQLDRSIPLFKELLRIRAKKLGADHEQTINVGANLGVNLKDAGQVKEAIPLFEKAHRASKKHPGLSWAGVNLLESYAQVGEDVRFARLLPEVLSEARKTLPKGSPQRAELLARISLLLLDRKQWTEAEPLIRECLAIREKALPDAWQTYNSRAQLGAALLGQKKYQDAEPLLLAGFEGMKKRADQIPLPGKPRLKEAAERLVQLYEATNRKDEAARWRKELAAHQTPPRTPKPRP